MSRFLGLILGGIGIGILVCTLFVLTTYSIRRIIIYIRSIKGTKAKGMRISDFLWLLFRTALAGLFIYDWGIFFVKIYDLIKKL